MNTDRMAIMVCLERQPDITAIQIGAICRLDRARLYTALSALEAGDWITSRWADEPYPRRRFYRIAE